MIVAKILTAKVFSIPIMQLYGYIVFRRYNLRWWGCLLLFYCSFSRALFLFFIRTSLISPYSSMLSSFKLLVSDTNVYIIVYFVMLLYTLSTNKILMMIIIIVIITFGLYACKMLWYHNSIYLYSCSLYTSVYSPSILTWYTCII